MNALVDHAKMVASVKIESMDTNAPVHLALQVSIVKMVKIIVQMSIFTLK